MSTGNQPQRKMTPADGINLLRMVAMTHTAMIEPFTRHSFGCKHFDIAGGFALFGLALLATQHISIRLYFYAWVVAMAYHRINGMRIRYKYKIYVHSLYIGVPWFAMRAAQVKTSEEGWKYEPLCVLAIGGALWIIHPLLGLVVATSSISYLVQAAIYKVHIESMVQNYYDSEIALDAIREEAKGRRI